MIPKKFYNRLGHFKERPLGRLFIVKIVQSKPEGVDLSRWLEMMFGLHERDIIQYETNRAFSIPGFYKPVPQVWIEGSKIQRVVPKNRRVWVRFDEKYPNVVDFEAPIGHGYEVRMFQLSLSQWNHVKMWLNPVRESDKKLHAEKSAAQV